MCIFSPGNLSVFSSVNYIFLHILHFYEQWAAVSIKYSCECMHICYVIKFIDVDDAE